MKVKGLKVIGIMVAVSGSVVMAQTEAPAPGAAGQGRQGGARMLERFDTDGDGVLSDAERTAMEASRGTRRRGAPAEAVASTDATEVVAAPAVGPDPKVLLKEFDGNKDGLLNEAELTKLLGSLKKSAPAPIAAPAPMAAPGAGMQSREAMMEQYDANKDGQLDETERAVMMEAMRARMGGAGGMGPRPTN